MASEHDRGGRTCVTCDFFKPMDASQVWGMCRRRAPVVVHDPNDDDGPSSAFPMIQTTDWCGEWETRA